LYQKGGKPPKLTVEDMRYIALKYLRDYRTMDSIAAGDRAFALPSCTLRGLLYVIAYTDTLYAVVPKIGGKIVE
jgi:hypothetical protein